MLLRALDSGEIVPLGAGAPRAIDVRVIAATDADIERNVAAGRFSRALAQRLAGYEITLPPLRDRRPDFGLLLLHLLRQVLHETGEAERLRTPTASEHPWLSASKVARLALGHWPGNVRALKNAARRIAVASRGAPRARIGADIEKLMDAERADSQPTATASHRLPPVPPPSTERKPNARELSDEELHEVFRSNRWNVSATAAALALPRATVSDMLDRNPLVKRAEDLPDEQVRHALDSSDGDLSKAADALEISLHALKLRCAQLRARRSTRRD